MSGVAGVTRHLGHAPGHHQEEARDTLERTFAAQKQRPVPADVQLADGHFENLVLKPRMNLHKSVEGRADNRKARLGGIRRRCSRLSVWPMKSG
jgi:hypothetical protein